MLDTFCAVFCRFSTQQELFEAVHNRLRAGEPPYHRASYKVKQNSFQNIAARDEVCWCASVRELVPVTLQ